MYPFERFTEDAKKTLTLAQEEAERARHSYIGTEHLLLGLLRLPSGIGHDVLDELGIDIETVRRTISSVLGRNERIIIQQPIPTSRVKVVIEIAFEEARRMGTNMVDSGHLLMALTIEGEGIAAHVLEDLGATAEKVVAAVERAHGAVPSGRGKKPSTDIRFPFPRQSASRHAQPSSSDVETLERLLAAQQIAALLRRRGLDVEKLKQQLGSPPDAVLKLRRQLAVAKTDLANAVSQNDYERAAQVQKVVAKQSGKLQSAEEDWLDKLGE